jgi:hypothetical protein
MFCRRSENALDDAEERLKDIAEGARGKARWRMGCWPTILSRRGDCEMLPTQIFA